MAATTPNPRTIPRLQKPLTADNEITITASRTLKASENGARVIFDSTTALTATLPAPFKGAEFTFFVKTPASATGHTVAVGTGPAMYGKVSPTGAAATATASKGRTNTQATSVVGDGLYVHSDGTNWFSTPVGTWATQA